MVWFFRELLDYLGDLVDQRVAKPLNDLISKLVVEQVSGVTCEADLHHRLIQLILFFTIQLIPGHIEKSDATQMAFLMLVAGNATMVSMINLVRCDLPRRFKLSLTEAVVSTLGHCHSSAASRPAQ